MISPHIEHAKIHWNDSGTPVSTHFDDIYYSNKNALEESRYVFLQQNQLDIRWLSFKRDRFVIAETGFGTGLNFLAVCQEFEKFREKNPSAKLQQLHFISFEKYPLSISDLEKIHATWPELAPFADALRAHYPPALSGCHRLILANGMITLDLWLGDIKETLPQVWSDENGLVDAWFLDGFSPNKNPSMWDPTLFNGVARLAKKSCTLASFTSAGFVRRGLIDAGFAMEKAKGFGWKREMIKGRFSFKKNLHRQCPWYKRTTPSHRDDIAIIGGGIASATLALALIRRGKKVTLYCEDEMAGLGASGNRQGAVFPLLNGNDDTVSRFFVPAFFFSRQFIEKATEPTDFDHQWCGVTQLAWNEKSAKKINKMCNAGYPTQLFRPLSSAETANITQINTGLDGIFFPLGGWLCPQQLTQVLIAKAKATGLLNCHFSTRITSIERKEKYWDLTQSNGNTHHNIVVIANGHQCATLTQTAPIPTYPVRGQVSHITTTHTIKKLQTVLCYEGYLTPVNSKNNTHCIGASYNRNDSGLDFRMEDQINNKARLVNCISKSWTTEIDVDNTAARVGVRSASRDHLPFAGDVCDVEKLHDVYQDLHQKKSNAQDIPVYPNLYCMLALGSRGLTSAPLLGELLASQICGDPLPLPLDVLNALHPGRMWVRKLLKGK